jgi:hypothetical protein
MLECIQGSEGRCRFISSVDLQEDGESDVDVSAMRTASVDRRRKHGKGHGKGSM